MTSVEGKFNRPPSTPTFSVHRPSKQLITIKITWLRGEGKSSRSIVRDGNPRRPTPSASARSDSMGKSFPFRFRDDRDVCRWIFYRCENKHFPFQPRTFPFSFSVSMEITYAKQENAFPKEKIVRPKGSLGGRTLSISKSVTKSFSCENWDGEAWAKLNDFLLPESCG